MQKRRTVFQSRVLCSSHYSYIETTLISWMLVLEHDQNVKGNIQIEATVMIFTSLSTVYFVVQAVFSLEILKC